MSKTKIENDFDFSISSGTASSIEAQVEAGIQLVKIVNVKLEDIEIKRGENKGTFKPTLVIKFNQISDSRRFFTHRIMTMETPDINIPKQVEKFKNGLEVIRGNIKNLIEQFIPFSVVEEGFFKGIKNLDELLERTSLCFNTGNNGQPIYIDKEGKPIVVYGKFTYGKDSNYLSLPYRYPLIEKAIKDGNGYKKSTFTINPKYDFLIASTGHSSSSIEENGFEGADDMPDF